MEYRIIGCMKIKSLTNVDPPQTSCSMHRVLIDIDTDHRMLFLALIVESLSKIETKIITDYNVIVNRVTILMDASSLRSSPRLQRHKQRKYSPLMGKKY